MIRIHRRPDGDDRRPRGRMGRDRPPPPPPPPVRAAEQRDIPRIAATLTLALGDSRWVRWALPTDGRMQRLTRLHELSAGHRGVATRTAEGTADVTGAATRGAEVTADVPGVATWIPPEGTSPLPADVRAALARELPFLHDDRWPV